jgi:hypothetical protein
VPTTKAVALTATLGAAAIANTAATAKAAVTGTTTAIDTALGTSPAAAVAGGTGGERPYNVTIKLEMDGDVLAKKQVQFLGGTVKSAFVEA